MQKSEGNDMMQPTIDEITNQCKKVIAQKITREEVGTWALAFILNEDNVEIHDIKAWHYLVSVSGIDEMIAPHVYLYSIEDIESWINQYNKEK